MTKSRTSIAALAVLALVMAGCGGEAQSDDAAADTQPAGADSPEDTSVTQAEPITTQAGSAPAEESAAEEQGDEGQDTSRLSGEGTFSVNGEESDTEWVVRCAPSDDFGGNPDERDLQLIAYSSDGGFLTVDVGVEDLEGMGENDYTYNTFGFDWGQSVVEEEIHGFTTSPDGDWYFGADPIQLARDVQTIDPLDPPPITLEGDRISGSVDISAIDPDQPDGATIAFDLSIPPETFDCSEL